MRAVCEPTQNDAEISGQGEKLCSILINLSIIDLRHCLAMSAFRIGRDTHHVCVNAALPYDFHTI